MTKQEFDEMAALVVRLRRQVEIEQSRATHESRERHALVLQLSAHVDALKQSNAQCSKLLVQNEQLTAELDRMKGDPLPIKLVGKLKDVETSNKTLHSELVNVRAALASVSAERDSLKRTLKEWEDADTAPHARVDPPIRMGLISETGPAVFVRIGAPPTDDIADHVVPPVLPMCRTCHECGGVLRPSRAAGSHSVLCCRTERCSRINTAWQDDVSPYHGPCKSATPVRHE